MLFVEDQLLSDRSHSNWYMCLPSSLWSLFYPPRP